MTHAAVDTLGHLLAMVVTPANEQERAQVAELVEAVQEVTGDHVEVGFVDQGYQSEEPAQAAAVGVLAPLGPGEPRAAGGGGARRSRSGPGRRAGAGRCRGGSG